MRILILNWRDPKNPYAGGAEKLNQQILKPFIDNGDKVTWYAVNVRGLPSHERFSNIDIVRYGNILTHFFAFPLMLLLHKFGKVDLIIDCIHGVGYYSSLFAPRTRKYILICEVAQNIWDEMFRFPMNRIGRFLEKINFILYKNNNFWTISQSTSNDLVSHGISDNQITVLPMGFDSLNFSKSLKKFPKPSALFVGRIAESKGIKDAMQAIYLTNKNNKDKWLLNIIGNGDKRYIEELKEMAANLKIIKYVKFLGFLSDKKKNEYMAQSWVLLVPSSREGWGMVVPEANYTGTLVVGYDSPGLREVLKKYSKQNYIIKNPDEISTILSRMKHPIKLKVNIETGWNSLYSYIRKNFINI